MNTASAARLLTDQKLCHSNSHLASCRVRMFAVRMGDLRDGQVEIDGRIFQKMVFTLLRVTVLRENL